MGEVRGPDEIVRDIKRDWKQPYFGAVPYLDALSTCTSWNDTYGWDGARDLGLYLLGNMKTWRGDVARSVKAELRLAVK